MTYCKNEKNIFINDPPKKDLITVFGFPSLLNSAMSRLRTRLWRVCVFTKPLRKPDRVSAFDETVSPKASTIKQLNS